MADIDYYEVHPHAGSVWLKMLEIWLEYLPNETWTFGVTYTTNAFSGLAFLVVVVEVVQDTDTVRNHMALSDTPTVSGYGNNPCVYVGSRPGFGAMPPVLPYLYGARSVIGDYDSNLHPAKITLLQRCTNAYHVSSQHASGGGYIDPQNFSTFTSIFFDRAGPWTMTDVIQTWDEDAVWRPAGDQPTINPYQEGVPGGGGSGGVSVDLAPLVAAVEELAMVDHNLSINNGSVMFSVTGKVRVG